MIKIRVPLFIFKARMLLEPTMGDRFTPGQPENRIRPRTHPRPDLVKIQEDKEPIALRNDQKRPSIGILAFTARFLLVRNSQGVVVDPSTDIIQTS